MMEAIKILRAVRQKEQDNNEVKYSDYDIVSAINEAIRYLNISLVHKDSEFLRKSKDYDEREMNAAIDAENEANQDVEGYEPKEREDFAHKGAALPDGYLSLVSVQRSSDYYDLYPATSLAHLKEKNYVLFGGRLYVKHRGFRLNYMGAVPEIKDVEKDKIELPDVFFDLLVKMARLVLNNGDADTLTQAVSAAVDSLIPRRRLSNMRSRMPFWM